MHCERAPCEYVCPVEATVHSAEGLNDMVYNRCVGTRFCSNNCSVQSAPVQFLPLRRFRDAGSLRLQYNPDVTVRSRGVMEKCTYCVQRIRHAQIDADREERPIADGEVVTACQAACPAGAIAFGDLSNSARAQSPSGEARRSTTRLLEELDTRPRTTYLAALRNPNPELEGGLTWPQQPGVKHGGARDNRRPRIELRYVPVGHTFASVTDKIARARARPAPRAGWFVVFGGRHDPVADLFGGRSSTCCSKGVGHLGHQRPGRLVLRDHQFRLVDRHRPRRHADLGDSGAAASEVADVDQPHRRGDDDFRRDVRGHVSALAPGTPVVLLLAACPIRTR